MSCPVNCSWSTSEGLEPRTDKEGTMEAVIHVMIMAILAAREEVRRISAELRMN